jgi:hypothetical protein
MQYNGAPYKFSLKASVFVDVCCCCYFGSGGGGGGCGFLRL